MSLKFEDTKYLVGYLVPLSAFVAIIHAGVLSFLTPIIGFVILPTLEIWFTGTDVNRDKENEQKAKASRFFDYMLYLNVPIQFALVILYLFRITGGGLATWEMIGITSSLGMCCGVLGINVAHELGHRRKTYEQIMAKMLLSTSLYMHFYIEHNRGHHKNVSTDLDPASAKYGESIYHFIPRSIFGAYFSAWNLENSRLRKAGQAVLSFKNEMVRFHIIELSMLAAIYLLFGWVALVGFIGAAFGGYMLLESVNYIEHYGLRRKELSPGVYEKCMPWHSWNSNHTFGRIMLYDLTRHSDHHYLAGRKYQVLRHFDDSPQMRMGYPGAILLAYIPPLWFHIMHKEIAQLKKGGVIVEQRESLQATG